MPYKRELERFCQNLGKVQTIDALFEFGYSLPAFKAFMEILLLQDVPNVGRKNDLLMVGDGFALNFLLPRRLALVATPLVRKQYAEKIRVRLQEREQERAARMGLLSAISGKQITFSKKASKTGKLYAAISEKHVAEALKQQLALDVTEENIDMPEHIKSVGSHQVIVRMGDLSQPVTVVVQAETAVK